MINQKNFQLGAKSSAIRELFEYGKIRKQQIGENNVYDFSIGNPSVASPNIVNETLIKLINEKEATSLHGYTSATGEITTRNAIASYLNKTFNCDEQGKYIYLTLGAAASLSIAFNALLNEDEEVILFAPFWPEYKVLAEKANGKIVIVKADKLIDESLENYDMIVCPGGLPGAEYLSKCELLINTIKKFDIADKINELNIDGLYLMKEAKRYYPYGTLLSHVLGYVGIDNQGLSGLELKYDDYLTGRMVQLNMCLMVRETD